MYSKPLPLPTYTQSEKYEKDGVLDMDLREEPTEEVPTQRRVVVVGDSGSDVDVGTCCEFTFFFIGGTRFLLPVLCDVAIGMH